MRRALALTALAIGGATCAGAAYATTGGDGRSAPTTLRFLDVPRAFELVDVGRPSTGENDLSAGDMLVFENDLRDPAMTRAVPAQADREVAATQVFQSVCTALVSPSRVLCRGSLVLRRGTIEISAAVDLSDDSPIVAAVTGGTRGYRDARGQVELAPAADDGTRIITVALRP